MYESNTFANALTLLQLSRNVFLFCCHVLVLDLFCLIQFTTLSVFLSFVQAQAVPRFASTASTSSFLVLLNWLLLLQLPVLALNFCRYAMSFCCANTLLAPIFFILPMVYVFFHCYFLCVLMLLLLLLLLLLVLLCSSAHAFRCRKKRRNYFIYIVNLYVVRYIWVLYMLLVLYNIVCFIHQKNGACESTTLISILVHRQHILFRL